MKIELIPSSVSFYVTHLTYKIEELHVNDSCNIVVYLCESDGNRIKRYDLCMEGEDYKNWGEDDLYLVDWLCNKCGVARQGSQVVEMSVQVENTDNNTQPFTISGHDIVDNTNTTENTLENNMVDNTVVDNTVVDNTVVDNTVVDNTETVVDNTETVVDNTETVVDNTVLDNAVVDNTVVDNTETVVDNTVENTEPEIVM
jgi:hypothetical protein